MSYRLPDIQRPDFRKSELWNYDFGALLKVMLPDTDVFIYVTQRIISYQRILIILLNICRIITFYIHVL